MKNEDLEDRLILKEQLCTTLQAQLNDFQQKSQNNSKSELVDQLEMENMELLAKLAQTEKQLQELRNQAPQSDEKESEVRLKDIQKQLIHAKSEVIQKINSEFLV